MMGNLSKLTEHQVLEARQKVASGEWDVKYLCEKYKRHSANIYDMLQGVTFKHLAGALDIKRPNYGRPTKGQPRGEYIRPAFSGSSFPAPKGMTPEQVKWAVMEYLNPTSDSALNEATMIIGFKAERDETTPAHVISRALPNLPEKVA